MNVRMGKIIIKNFKNLKDVTIRPKKFTVLIGPNGSGKTNFLEFFKLLRKIYAERNPYPFLEWDGYENVVWNHQINLPIEFELETVERTNLTELTKRYWIMNVEFEKDISFEIFHRLSASFWADKAENLRMLRESVEVEIPDFNFRFSIEKSGDIWRIRLNERVYELNNRKIGIKSLHFEILKIIEDSLRFESLMRNITVRDTIIYHIIREIHEKAEYFKSELSKLDDRLSSLGISPKVTVLGLRHPISMIIFESAFPAICQPLFTLLKVLTLFSLNITEIKYKRRIIPREELLSERGENVLDILALMQLKNNKLPERIEYAMETYFNGRMYFKNMNLYLYDTDRRVEFSKEHLPDGLIKMLVILTAIEQNPSILLIDEIENSLHPELIEFLVEMLREEHDGCTFIATHSPVVLNLAEPEEIWIFKPTKEEVEIKNVTEYKDKEELLKELEELGITLGEKVLYGFT